MQSVLGGQTLGMIVIAAPNFPVWTGSQHLRDQNPFYHERALKKAPHQAGLVSKTTTNYFLASFFASAFGASAFFASAGLAADGLASSFLAGAVWAATESANTDATIAINAFMRFPL
jgi:hypothetical protein